MAVIVKFPPVLYTIQAIFAVIAARAALLNLAGIASKLTEIQKTGKKALNVIGDLFKPGGLKKYRKELSGAWDTFKSTFGGGKVQSKAGDWYSKDSPQGKMIENMKKGGGSNTVEDLSKKTSDASKNEPKSNGKNIKEFLQNLGRGIKSFGKSVTFTDIAKIAAAGAGFLVFTLAAPGLAVVALLGTPAGIGLEALGVGILAFGKSMQALGPQGLGYAAAGMLILAGGLLSAGFALNLAAPAFEAIGKAIKSAFEGIGSILVSAGTAIATILKEVTLERAAALIVMGAGFVSLAAGLTVLSASALFAIPALGVLGAIALMGPGLLNAGTGMEKIAQGVAKLSEALQSLETSKLEEVKDLISSTALAAPAIAATGAITSLIQGIAGTGGGSDDPVVAKIQELIDLVGSGKVVELKLDSETISKQQMLSMTKGK